MAAREDGGRKTKRRRPGVFIGNCGCFGVHLGQPLRWWVLFEDAEFVALTVWIHRAERRLRSGSAVPEPEGADRAPGVVEPGSWSRTFTGAGGRARTG